MATGRENNDEPSVYDPGEVVAGKYEVIDKIGWGGEGMVLSVYEIVDGQRVGVPLALKYSKAKSDTARERFAREVKLLQAIRHENVVSLFHAGLDHDPPFYTMPLAVGTLEGEGPTLANGHPAALEAFKDMCRGIIALHASQGLHRDIKPKNALRMPDGRVVISDLGLARDDDPEHQAHLTSTTAIMGTMAYAAPEQMYPGGFKNADARTEVCALGKCLYFLLTGTEPPAIIDTNNLPPGLGRIVGKATRHIKFDRYKDVSALLTAVEQQAIAQDPTQDPIYALTETIRKVKGGRLDKHLLDEMLDEFPSAAYSSARYCELFDEVPTSALQVMAKTLPAKLRTVIQGHHRALGDGILDERSWSYADALTPNMMRVLQATSDLALKAEAFRVALVTSTDKDQYNAMDLVVSALHDTTDGDVAAALAEVLDEEPASYRHLARRIDSTRLHHVLRRAHERAQQSRVTDSGN